MKVMMDYFATVILLFAFLGAAARASPILEAEAYMNDYINGIEELKSHAKEYVPEEESFDKYKDVEILEDKDKYDFIIIGGGTAGAVLASRLTEIPEYRVLLLEAGGDETKITKIPSMAHILPKTKFAWGYKTVPQKTWCLDEPEGQCDIPQGKLLGGTSSINDMIYTRGNARDYDLWADEGNKEWCFEDILPYFKKSEDAQLHHFDRKYHQQGGLLRVKHSPYHNNLTDAVLHAGKELGFAPADYNGKDQIGFNMPQVNMKDGERLSTYEAYVRKFGERKNLVVLPYSRVIELIISPHAKDVRGVKYIHKGNVVVSKADKEYILAAGPINSAQIMLLSGVGPKEDLGEECVHELPVGAYLKDHPTFTALKYHYKEHKDCEEGALFEYLKNHEGPMTSNGVSGLAFIKTAASKDNVNYPDAYLTFKPKDETSFSVEVTATHPESHGTLKLKTKDPLHFPKIDLNHLSDEDDRDMKTMLAAIREAQKICDTKAFKELDAEIIAEPIESCAEHEFDSDSYWKCAIRHKTVSAGHYTGTCKMGKSEKSSVVNHKLQVHGINKLRIADASVIPVDITGHTQAAEIVVAEKAADFIKDEWH